MKLGIALLCAALLPVVSPAQQVAIAHSLSHRKPHRNRRGAGWRVVVHRMGWTGDRTYHHFGCRDHLPRAHRQRLPIGHRAGARWGALVYRIRERQDRTHHHRRSDRRVSQNGGKSLRNYARPGVRWYALVLSSMGSAGSERRFSPLPLSVSIRPADTTDRTSPSRRAQAPRCLSRAFGNPNRPAPRRSASTRGRWQARARPACARVWATKRRWSGSPHGPMRPCPGFISFEACR